MVLNSFHFDMFYPLKGNVYFQCSVLNSSWQILFPHLSYGSKVIMKMPGMPHHIRKNCKDKTFFVITSPSHKSLYFWKPHKLWLASSLILSCAGPGVSAAMGRSLVCAAHPSPGPGHLPLHDGVQGPEIWRHPWVQTSAGSDSFFIQFWQDKNEHSYSSN